MPPRKPKSDDLPAQLDALDDKIHDLLVRRARLSTAVAPAEQAVRLRRLAARHKGEMPLAVLLRIWREMMAPAGAVHVYSADRAGKYRDLARDLFGSLVAMKSHLSASAIVHECAGDAAAFGVVPPPESDESARAWWAQLTPVGQTGPRVVATVPFVGPAQAYVVGSLEPVASGDDTTLFLLEAGDTLSLTRLQALLKQGGFDARLVAVSRESARSALRYHLLEVAGFVRDDDARLGALREQAGDMVQRIVCVGCYANPIAQAAS